MLDVKATKFGQSSYSSAWSWAFASSPRSRRRPSASLPSENIQLVLAYINKILWVDTLDVCVRCVVGLEKQVMQSGEQRLQLLRAAPQDPGFKLRSMKHRGQSIGRNPCA
jgi:hypothetical protein